MDSNPNNFVEAFKGVAHPILARHPQLRFVWENPPKGGAYTLRILKDSPEGFDVGVEVQAYGLYPFAGDWRGVPWDIAIPGTEIIPACNYALGLIRTLLSTDMRLKARCAGGRAYKWGIEEASPKGWISREEQIAVIFYNYFAARSERFFQNSQLPPLGFAAGTAKLDWFETVWP